MPVSNIPEKLLYNFYVENEQHIKRPYDQFKKEAHDVYDREHIEAMGEWLHSRHPEYSKEQSDQELGLTQWREEKPGWFENVGRGMAERGYDLAGGLVELAAIGARELGIEDDDGTISAFAESLRDADFGYEEWTSWEDVKEAPLANVFQFAMEQGLISAPDMAAVLFNLPAYIAARTGELASDRGLADGMRKAQGKDLFAALPTAVASAMLERIGAKGILGKGGKLNIAGRDMSVLELAKQNMPKTGGVQGLAGAVGRAGAKEALTEAGQEAIEYTGTHVGTETGFDPAQAGEAALIGGTVGALFGGTVRGGTAAAQIAQGKTQDQFQAEVERVEQNEADRSVASRQFEEEVRQGKRNPIPFSNLPNMGKVVVAPWDGESVSGIAVRGENPDDPIMIMDDQGNSLMQFDPNETPDAGERPTFFYEQTEEEKAGVADLTDAEIKEKDQVDAYNEEISRVMQRSDQEDLLDTQADAIKSIRKDKRFEALPEELKNEIDDRLDKHEKKLADEKGEGTIPQAQVDQIAERMGDIESGDQLKQAVSAPDAKKRVAQLLDTDDVAVNNLVKQMTDYDKEVDTAESDRQKAESELADIEVKQEQALERLEGFADKLETAQKMAESKPDSEAAQNALQTAELNFDGAQEVLADLEGQVQKADDDVSLATQRIKKADTARQKLLKTATKPLKAKQSPSATKRLEKKAAEKKEIAKISDEITEKRRAAARKGVETRKANVLKKRRSDAAKKGAATRKANKLRAKRSEAAKKGAVTRAANRAKKVAAEKAAKKKPVRKPRTKVSKAQSKKEQEQAYKTLAEKERKSKNRKKANARAKALKEAAEAEQQRIDEGILTPEQAEGLKSGKAKREPETGVTFGKSLSYFGKKIEDAEFETALDRSAARALTDVEDQLFAGVPSTRKYNNAIRRLEEYDELNLKEKLTPELRDAVDEVFRIHASKERPVPLDQFITEEKDRIEGLRKRFREEQDVEAIAEAEAEALLDEGRGRYGTTMDAPKERPKTMRERGFIPDAVQDEVAVLENAIVDNVFNKDIDKSWDSLQDKYQNMSMEEKESLNDVIREYKEHKKKFVRKAGKRKTKKAPSDPATRQDVQTHEIIGNDFEIDQQNYNQLSELLYQYYSFARGGSKNALVREINAIDNLPYNKGVDRDLFNWVKLSLSDNINPRVRNKLKRTVANTTEADAAEVALEDDLDMAALATNLRMSRHYISKSLLLTTGLEPTMAFRKMRERMAHVMGPDKSSVPSRKTVKAIPLGASTLSPIVEDQRIFKDKLGESEALTDPFYRPPYSQNKEMVKEMTERYKDSLLNPTRFLGEDLSGFEAGSPDDLIGTDELMNMVNELSDTASYRHFIDETTDSFDLNKVAQLSSARTRDIIQAHQVLTKVVKHYVDLKREGKLVGDDLNTRRMREMAGKFGTMLMAVDMEMTKRQNYNMVEKLADLYAIELKPITEVENGVPVEKWRINNKMVHARRIEESAFMQLEGVAQVLREASPDTIPKSRHMFKHLGGKKGTDETVNSRSKTTWTFDENIFDRIEIRDALGLDRERDTSVDLAAEVVQDKNVTEIQNFEAGDIAPKLKESEKLHSSVQRLLDRGKKYLPEQVVEYQKEDAARMVKAFNSGKRGFVIATPPGSGKTFMLGGAIKQLLRDNKDLNVLYVTLNPGLVAQVRGGEVEVDVEQEDGTIAKELKTVKGDLEPFFKKNLEAGEVEGKPPEAGMIRVATYQTLDRSIPQGAHKDKVKGTETADEGLKNWVDKNTVIIFDEGDIQATMGNKYSTNLYYMTKNSKFNILATGTPFKNPAHAEYLRYFGVYDQFHNPRKKAVPDMPNKPGAQGFYHLLGEVGGKFNISARYGPKAKAVKEKTSDLEHPSTAPTSSWEPDTDEAGKKDLLMTFLKKMLSTGQYMTRPPYTDKDLVEHEFEHVDTDARHLQTYVGLEKVYREAEKYAKPYGFKELNLWGHFTGLRKDFAEVSKIQEAANKVVMEAYHPTRIVNYSGKRAAKPKHSMRMQAIVDAMNAGDSVRWRNLLFSKVDTNPGEEIHEGEILGWVSNKWGGRFQTMVADGKLKQRVWLNKKEWVEVEIQPRKVVNFIEHKTERHIGKFKVTAPKKSRKKGSSYDDINAKGKPMTVAEKDAEMAEGRVYTKEEVIEYADWYMAQKKNQKKDKDGNATFDFGKSKFQPQQIALARAYAEVGLEPYDMPNMKTAMKDALVQRGIDPDKILFYTGDETGTAESIRAKKEFQSDKKDSPNIMVVTVAAGGTGLSLHDLSLGGKMPRSIVGLGLGWMSKNHTQAEGRIVRLGMTSKARIKWLVAPSLKGELEVADKLQERLFESGYATTGNRTEAQTGISGMINNITEPVGYETFPDEDAYGVMQDIGNLADDIGFSFAVDPETAALLRQMYTAQVDREKTALQAPPEHVRMKVREITKQMMPGVKVDLNQFVDVPGSGYGMPRRAIAGYYQPQKDDSGMIVGPGIIKLAMKYGPEANAKAVDVVNTIGHESVHYFRQNGLITNKEWVALLREVQRTKAMDKYNIKERYPDASRDKHYEEAVAEMFGDYVALQIEKRDGAYPPLITRVFDRILQFFKAVAEAFGKTPSAEDIQQRMYEGVVGRRRPTYQTTMAGISERRDDGNRENQRNRRARNRQRNQGLSLDQKYEQALNKARKELPMTPDMELLLQNLDASYRDSLNMWGRAKHRGKLPRSDSMAAALPKGTHVFTSSEMVNDWMNIKRAQEREYGAGKYDAGVMLSEMQKKAQERIQQNKDATNIIVSKGGLAEEATYERVVMQATDRLIMKMFPGMKVAKSMDGHHYQFPNGVFRVKDHKYAYGKKFGYEVPKWQRIYRNSQVTDKAYRTEFLTDVYNTLAAIKNDLVSKGHKFSGPEFSPRAKSIPEPDISFRVEDVTPDNDTLHTMDNPEHEERWRESTKGKTKTNLMSGISDKLKKAWERSTRHFEHLDVGKKKGQYNAELVQKLLNYEASKANSVEEIDRYFRDMLKHLKKTKEYDLFSRIIFFRDLKWTAEKGMDIPLGLDLESVTKNLAEVEAIAENHPNIQEALKLRATKLDEMRRRMLAAGILTQESAQNTDYIHHQVLEYATMDAKGQGGRKLTSPTQFRRKGSKKDINAEYFEVEAEWMHKALTDMATMELGNWLRTSKYNEAGNYRKQAVIENDTKARDILKRDMLLGLKSLTGDKKVGAKAQEIYDAILESKFDNPTELAALFSSLMKDSKISLKKADSDKFIFTKEVMNNRRQIASAFGEFGSFLDAIKRDPNSTVWQMIPPDLKHKARLTDNAEESPDLLRVAAWFAKQNAPVMQDAAVMANNVFGAIHSKRFIYRQMLGDDYINPDNKSQLLHHFGDPGSQALWQMESKHGERALHTFTGMTVSEHVFERSEAAIMESIEEVYNTTSAKEAYRMSKKGDKVNLPVKEVMEMLKNTRAQTVVGGPKEEMILPDYIATQLNELGDPHTERLLGTIAASTQRYWKVWILMNPRRITKYMLNNVTGDLDAILANPSAYGTFSELKQSSKEIMDWLKGKPVTLELQEALNMGVIGSTLSAQEIPTEALESLDRGGSLSLDPRKYAQGNIGMRGFRKYFRAASNLVTWREATVRYAAYRNYRKKIVTEGKTPEQFGYGATAPWMIQGVQDKYELAAMMARDALGDYGNISVNGRMLRKKVIPFWSWIESNTRRYYNLGRNIYQYPSETKGRSLAGMAMGAGLALRMSMFYLAVQVYNNLFFGDDEDELSAEERMRMHLNMGSLGSDDRRFSIRFQGALSDQLGWIGMENVGGMISDVQRGYASPKDIMVAMSTAAPNKILNSITPLYKLPLELGQGKRWFPDFFNPVDIHNPWDHFLRSFSLENEAAALMNAIGQPMPMKGEGGTFNRYMRSFEQLLLSSRTVGESEYNRLRSDVFKWKAEQFESSDLKKVNANLRRARKYGHESAIERLEAKKAEMTGRPVRRSRMDDMSPYKGMSRDDKRDFIRSRTPEERARDRKALKYSQGL